MKLLFDFFPILLFFITYKFFGIFAATAVAIAVSFLQILTTWLKYRRVDKMLVTTFLIVTLLGGTTLLLHEDIYIKWKTTIIYWLFGLILLGSQLFGSKVLMQRMLSANLTLPSNTWRRLNLAWGIFFIAIGFLNLFVVYNFSTDFWVNFKLFGIIGLTLIFGIIQALFLAKYVQPDDNHSETTSSK